MVKQLFTKFGENDEDVILIGNGGIENIIFEIDNLNTGSNSFTLSTSNVTFNKDVHATTFVGTFSGNGESITNIKGYNITSGTINTNEIANGAVTDEKIATSISATKITTGTMSGARITSNTITATQIADKTIAATQIADNTITALQIADGAVTDDKIAPGISATKITKGTVSGGRITSKTITDTQIADKTITDTQIADKTITSTQIADNTITATQIADNTITATQIANNTITATQIANNTINTLEIADHAVTSAKLDTNITIDDTLSVVGNVVIGAKLDVTGDVKVTANISAYDLDITDTIRFKGTNDNYLLKFDENNTKLTIGTESGTMSNIATEEFVSTFAGSANNNASFDQVDQHIIPATNATYDLGAPDKRWKNLYLSGNQINFADGLIIDSHDWSYLTNYVVPPKASVIEQSMRKLFKGSAQDHSAYIKSGEVWTFGRNDLGQLGLGDYVNRAQPTLVSGITNAKAVAIGESFTVVLKEDGTAVAFGVNTNGQLGDGTTNNTNISVDVVGITNATDVSIGRTHTLFLLATGEVVGFGSNSRGQLGVGNTSVQNLTAVTMNLPDFTGDATLKARFISTGAYHSVVLLENGSAYVCGDNTYNQLGADGTVASLATTPGIVPSISNIVYAGCGENHTILIRYNGEVLACGDNKNGQLGIGNKSVVTTFRIIISAPGASNPDAGLSMEADGGADHTVVLKYDESVVLFGSNLFGQLGMGPTVTEKLVPTTLSGYFVYSAAAGRNHTILLLKQTLSNHDTTVAFGDNKFGQMGDADAKVVTRWIPNVIYGSLYAKKLSTARGYNTAIIDTDSTLFMCGQNNYGQARGDGSTSSSETLLVPFVMPDSLVRIDQVAMGSQHTVVLDSTGQVHAWGNNNNGQLGNGTTTNRYTLVNVSSYGTLNGKTIVAIACGGSHTVALDITGQVHTWGYTYSSSSPINFSSYGSLSGKTIVAIACGWQHTVALDNTGEVHAWGGDDTTPSSVPMNVSEFGSLIDKTVVSISCGDWHTVAVDNTGQVHAWGLNSSGQLGRNNTTDSSVPVNVSEFGSLKTKTIIAISCGGAHTVALDSTGQVHACGGNNYGQLGDGATTNRNTTVNVSAFGSLRGKTIVAIACATYHTLALDSTGQVHAWGFNGYGQIGDGTTTDMWVSGLMDKTVFTEHKKLSSEGSFSQHKLFISDKPLELRAVGTNTYGQIGDSTTIDRLSAITLSFPYDVIASATGVNHSACVLSDGSLYTWGCNNNIQCGINNGCTNITNPAKVFGITSAKSVVCGADFTLVLLADKSVLAFGLNSVGQLGLDASVTTAEPTPVGGLTNIVKLSAGGDFAVALDANGHIKTWGSNAVGATGQGTDVGNTVGSTAIVLSENVVDVAAGKNHLVLVMKSGAVMTCGLNDKGQLGRSDNFETTVANTALALTEGLGTYARAIRVVAGNGYTVVLLNNGCLRTFGNNVDGQLTAVPGVVSHQWEPVNPNVRTARAISTALDTTYYEEYYSDSINTVFGFGKYKSYVTKSIGFASSTLTYTIAGRTRYPSYASVDCNHTVANVGGQVYAWGYNYYGQLGDNDTTNSYVPKNVSSYGSLNNKTVVAIASGRYHTLALDNTGYVHAWGLNGNGQLGIDDNADRSVPMEVSRVAGTSSLSDKTVVAIACGDWHTVALDSTGKVHAWGRNNNGQLGDNDTENSWVPVNVSSVVGTSSLYGKTIVAVACGAAHTVALDSTGQVHVWGNNEYGALGNGSTANSSVPMAVSSYGTLKGKIVIAISCGALHTVALDNMGQVHAWGYNPYGQLGNNSTIDSTVPVEVSRIVITSSLSDKTVVAISCGGNHTIALDSAGMVHAWGWNIQGQLGNGSTTQMNTPINVSGFGSLNNKKVIAISCEGYHTVALDSTGKVHVWGFNYYGELGDGGTANSWVPKQISLSIPTNNNVGTNDFFINFTGQHRCFVDGITNIPSLMSSEGLIVVSDTNSYIDLLGSNSITTGKNAITVNNSLPILSLSRKAKDKRVFGVVSVKANDESTPLGSRDLAKLAEAGDIRAQINSVGEGALWVSDVNGIIEAGDYITSSDLRGYGMKQDEITVVNYTVAKATMDCDFEPAMVPVKELILDVNGNLVIDPETGRPTWKVAMEQSEAMSGPLVERMEPAYTVKYINYDLETDVISTITKAEYDTAKAAGSGTVYRVALIGCTYHCG
jgi:alpha-tubulin suppressor-like RCC1 family protein